MRRQRWVEDAVKGRFRLGARKFMSSCPSYVCLLTMGAAGFRCAFFFFYTSIVKLAYFCLWLEFYFESRVIFLVFRLDVLGSRFGDNKG